MLKNVNKKVLIFAVLVIFLFIAYYNQNIDQEQKLNSVNNLNSLTETKSQSSNVQKKEIIVHLSGAVSSPGVYRLNQEERLVDLIEAAGGLTKKADLKKLNLAENIYDGQKVIIPEIIKKDVFSNSSANSAGNGAAKNNLYDYSSHENQDLINVNQASQSVLEKLSGIGPSKASAILKYREKNGFFEQKEDLLEVSGIGDKTLENIEDEIRLR